MVNIIIRTFVGDHAVFILGVAAGSNDVFDFLLFQTLAYFRKDFKI